MLGGTAGGSNCWGVDLSDLSDLSSKRFGLFTLSWKPPSLTTALVRSLGMGYGGSLGVVGVGYGGSLGMGYGGSLGMG